MAKWLHTVDISEDYALAEDEDNPNRLSIKDLIERSLPKFRTLPGDVLGHIEGYLTEWEDMAERAKAEGNDVDADEFDETLGEIYSACDVLRVWIKTF